jgi:hypothetical protein
MLLRMDPVKEASEPIEALARFGRICRVSRVMQPYLDAIA